MTRYRHEIHPIGFAITDFPLMIGQTYDDLVRGDYALTPEQEQYRRDGVWNEAAFGPEPECDDDADPVTA